MDQPNASGIGVQTMQKDGTKNNPQPGQYEKQYEPAATTETTVTKTETPKKKGKKGCIIFIVLIVCCLITLIGGGIAAYLNAGTILKSIANSTKDTTYTTYTTSTISAFKLSDFMSKQTAAVDANGDMTFDFDLDTIAKYALSAVPSAIQTDIGVKLAPGQILINMPMSDLQPTIISKDNFKDIYVKIILVVGTDKKSFSVSSVSTGNSIVDYFLPANISSTLSSNINQNLGDLGVDLSGIVVSADNVSLTYNVPKYDLTTSTSLVGEEIPTSFDYTTLRKTVIDSSTVDIFYTPKQWLETLFAATLSSTTTAEDLYLNFNNDVLTYYVNVGWVGTGDIQVDFAQPANYYCKVVMKVINKKEMGVDSVSCNNPIIDKYFTKGFLNDANNMFGTGISAVLTEWQVANNELRVRGVSV